MSLFGFSQFQTSQNRRMKKSPFMLLFTKLIDLKTYNVTAAVTNNRK